MSLVQRRHKKSSDFIFVITGYIRITRFKIKVPQCLVHLMYMFMVYEKKKRILSLDYRVSDVICSSVSSLSKIFALSTIFRKIKFSIGTVIVEIYPWINKYKINNHQYVDIKSFIGNAWNCSQIYNIQQNGVKFMVALHRKTSESCKCTKDAFMEIIIFSENKKILFNESKNAIFSSEINDLPWYAFESSINDAYIKINLTQHNLQYIDDSVWITIYDGHIYSYEDWRCKGIVEGICCVNAANEGCDDDHILDDQELYYIIDERWETLMRNRKNALKEYYSK